MAWAAMRDKADRFQERLPHHDVEVPTAVKFGLEMRQHIIGDGRTADFSRNPVHLVSVDVGSKHLYIRLDFDQMCSLVLAGPNYVCSCVRECRDPRYPDCSHFCTLSCPKCHKDMWRVRFDRRLTGFTFCALPLCCHISCSFRLGAGGYGVGVYVFDCTDIVNSIRSGLIPEYSDMGSIFSRLCRAALPASATVRLWLERTGTSLVRRRVRQLRSGGLLDLRSFVDRTRGLVRRTQAVLLP
jgi:hypothetical protein